MAIMHPGFLQSLTLLSLVWTKAESEVLTCSGGWGYNEIDGPGIWSKGCPACSGSSQSPIAIQPETVTLAQLSPIKFFKYDEPIKHLPILDTGHSEELDIVHELGLSIEIPSRPGVIFNLVQIHFHWGQDNQANGSEHAIGEKSFPFEVHFVHKTANGSMIAVLAVFGEVHCKGENAVLSAISKALDGVDVNPSDVLKLKSQVTVKDLLPSDTSLFFAYSGSLTTPPCSETVDWIVFEKPITIHPTLLNDLRQLISDDNTTITENHRPRQPLNGRKVYYSGSVKPSQPKISTTLVKCNNGAIQPQAFSIQQLVGVTIAIVLLLRL